ncbi:MAG: hypothetical protein ACP5F3_01890 [Candidatus Syntrophosphaera sp.]
MKKGILILALVLAVTVIFAFPKGTFNPGGTISFSSYKVNSDADPVNMLTIAPQAGLFVMDNLCVDGLISYQTDTEDWNHIGLGIGGRYFFGNIYAGLGLMYGMDNNDDYSATQMSADLKAGYLLQIARNAYLDVGAKYNMGFGEFGGDASGDNEQSRLTVGAGFQIFYPTTLFK